MTTPVASFPYCRQDGPEHTYYGNKAYNGIKPCYDKIDEEYPVDGESLDWIVSEKLASFHE